MDAGATGTVHRVTVTIYGESYALRGDAPPEHLQSLAARVDQRMREIGRRNPRLGTARVAVLAALHLADELQRLEEQYSRALGMLEMEWERRKKEMEAAEP
jgi:cell division protein ZapA